MEQAIVFSTVAGLVFNYFHGKHMQTNHAMTLVGQEVMGNQVEMRPANPVPYPQIGLLPEHTQFSDEYYANHKRLVTEARMNELHWTMDPFCFGEYPRAGEANTRELPNPALWTYSH